MVMAASQETEHSEKLLDQSSKSDDNRTVNIVLGAITIVGVGFGVALRETYYLDQDVVRIRFLLESLGIGK